MSIRGFTEEKQMEAGRLWIGEKVGRNCECIFPFEKFYVNMLCENRIEEEEKKLAEMEEHHYPPALIGFTKSIINDLKTVKERFAIMPECTGER